MDIFQAIYSRVPVEEYTEEPLEFDKITQLVDAANHASCTGNLHAWKFILVTNKDKIRSLIPYCMKQEALYTAQFAIVVCVEESHYETFYGLRGKRLYAIQDCGAAIQNMLLSAYALGIGAHWIRAFDEDRIRDIFSIPDGVRPQAIITLGYAISLPTRKQVKDLQTMVFFNGYGDRIEYGYRVLRDYSVDVQQYKKLVQEQLKPQLFSLKEHARRLLLKSHKQVVEKTEQWKTKWKSRKIKKARR